VGQPPLQRHCHTQQTCFRGEWFQLPILQLSREQEKFAGCKIDIGAGELSGQTTNDCELPKRRDRARPIEIPFPDFK